MPFVTGKSQPKPARRPPGLPNAPANRPAHGPARQTRRPGAGKTLSVLRHPARQSRRHPRQGRPETRRSQKEDAKKGRGQEPKQGPLFLQAGSFSTPHDADNQKANLALMGLEASVQQVMVQDKTHHCVRLGPFGRVPEEVNKVRADLAKSGIEASLVKNKE